MSLADSRFLIWQVDGDSLLCDCNFGVIDFEARDAARRNRRRSSNSRRRALPGPAGPSGVCDPARAVAAAEAERVADAADAAEAEAEAERAAIAQAIAQADAAEAAVPSGGAAVGPGPGRPSRWRARALRPELEKYQTIGGNYFSRTDINTHLVSRSARADFGCKCTAQSDRTHTQPRWKNHQ